MIGKRYKERKVEKDFNSNDQKENLCKTGSERKKTRRARTRIERKGRKKGQKETIERGSIEHREEKEESNFGVNISWWDFPLKTNLSDIFPVLTTAMVPRLSNE